MANFRLISGVLLLFVFMADGHAQENDVSYQTQGEYSGKIDIGEGSEVKYGIQVIALGDNQFTGVGYMGGLPGDGWDKETPTTVADVSIEDGILKFESDDGTALIANGIATINGPDGDTIGKLKRVVRRSPTLGKEPPKNAIVLFDGSSVDGWHFKGKPARMTDDGLLQQGANSKEKFQSHRIHIEFLLPYKPKARGQARGNSGIYLQGRYEVQMLDSFGLSGEHNECGGIYKTKKPDQNMCFPPMQWQTYDIDFHAAKFDGEKKTRNAWMTVKHNGVVIHNRVEVPAATTASPLKDGPEPGFIHLQDHGNPVQYRNIWVEPLQQTAESFELDEETNVDYWLGLPENYASQEEWPLMLFLHGAGERGDGLEIVKKHGPPRLLRKGDKLPFIVVSPQCKKGQRWEPEQLSKLLDNLESKLNVDKKRVYVTGLSMGGYGTWALAAHSPERFAAVAPICGGGRPTFPELIKDKVPVWCFHGAKDSVVPLEQSQKLVDGLKALGVDVKFTIYPEANHDSWTATYDNAELYEWLLSHSK